MSDYDFELLARDLLSEHLNLYFHNFKRGRDGGIDLRCSISKDGDAIVQCKHYARTPFNKLIVELEREYHKVEALNPKRYIIFTSLELSSANKDAIYSALDPYILSIDDIFGYEDINYLLGIHPDVEKRNFKLWLSSITLLDIAIHSRILSRTSGLFRRILDESKRYVEGEALKSALKILNENYFCLISGIPGTGKTTLARIILLIYAKNGYEAVYISSDIDEAFDMFRKDKKQVFYFDDFLGKTRLTAGALNHDQRLVDFINLLSHHKNSVLILTTREYVLNQAIEILGDFEFQIPLLTSAKYMVEMESYSTYEKALILYNHLFYSNVTKSKIGTILNSAKYQAIVEHRNYIPRIIDWVINHDNQTTDENFADLLLQHLENPEKIWKVVLENHISQSARNLISILYVYESTEYDILKAAYKEYSDTLFILGYSQDAVGKFDHVLKELSGTLITITTSNGGITIEFNNSSIIDYLNIFFSSSIEYLVRIVKYSHNIRLLWHLASATFKSTHSLSHTKSPIAFLNPVFQFELVKSIEEWSFVYNEPNVDIVIKDEDMVYVLERSFIISSNRLLYTKLILDLANKFISESFTKKHPYIYAYIVDVKNTITIAKMSQSHHFLIHYALNNLNELIKSADSLTDALKILKIYALLQYPTSMDIELNSRIRAIILKNEEYLEDLDESEISSMVKLCDELLEYDSSDKKIKSILEDLNNLQLERDQEEEQDDEEQEVDPEKDEIGYTESISDTFIDYEYLSDSQNNYFKELSDLFYDPDSF